MGLQIRKVCPCEHSHFFPSLSENILRVWSPPQMETHKTAQTLLSSQFFFFFLFPPNSVFWYKVSELRNSILCCLSEGRQKTGIISDLHLSSGACCFNGFLLCYCITRQNKNTCSLLDFSGCIMQIQLHFPVSEENFTYKFDLQVNIPLSTLT